MRLLIVHLLSEPESDREKRSVENVSSLMPFFDYIQIVNKPFQGELPPSRETNDRGFELGPGHYGCFSAHKSALELLTPEYDGLLICECDCLFVESVEQIVKRIVQAYGACVHANLPIFTFGFKHNGKTLEQVGRDVIVISQLIETHCLLIPRKTKSVIEELFQLPWDTADFIYTVYGYDQRRLRIGTFSDRAVAIQASGVSLLDNTMKDTEDHYRNLRYSEWE